MTVSRYGNIDWSDPRDVAALHGILYGPDGDEPCDVANIVEARDRANRPVPVKGITQALARRARDRAVRFNRSVAVRRAVGRGWVVRQSRRSGAEAGSVVVVRRGGTSRLVASRLRLLSPKGRDVQARYLRDTVVVDRDHGKTVRYIGAHHPLLGSGVQDDANRTLARLGDELRDWRGNEPTERLFAAGGDGNQRPPHLVATAVLRSAYGFGADVMWCGWSPGWGETETRAYEVTGSDHAVLEVRSGRDVKDDGRARYRIEDDLGRPS